MQAAPYFAIVGTLDNPMYMAELRSTGPAKAAELSHLQQLILHAALDNVEDAVWHTSNMFLKTIDRFNDLFVSAFKTASGPTMLLLHEGLNADSIRQFFIDVHELYIKTLLNPFYEPNMPLSSPAFDAKVRLAARRITG